MDFFRRYLRHTKGRYANSPFILQDWQANEIIRPIFGTLNERGTRQYRRAYVEIPRKNGKSEIAAGVALKLLLADGEPGGEVYSAACDRSQAAIVYDVAAQMVRNNPLLSKRCRITDSQRNIAVPKTHSKYRVVSADAGRQHGLNPHGVIFDELHTQRNGRLWAAMTTGSGTREQPLIFAITTAGIEDEAPVWVEEREYARQVREGIFQDETFLGIHYAADPKDDFDDPAVWKKANPALGTFLSFESFRDDHRAARRKPQQWNDFLRYRLNVPTQQSERWLNREEWDACAAPIDWDAFRGKPAYLGLDLSTRRDMTALVAAFVGSDGKVYLRPWFWLPEERCWDRLRPWVQSGLITLTPGNTVDFAAVRAKINELKQTYAVQKLAYDPWNAEYLAQELQVDGIEVVEMPYRTGKISMPAKEFESLLGEFRFRHDGNEVLRWQVDVVSVKPDANGNILPEKPNRLKSEKRIDGVVASIMASHVALSLEQQEPEPRILFTI